MLQSMLFSAPEAWFEACPFSCLNKKKTRFFSNFFFQIFGFFQHKYIYIFFNLLFYISKVTKGHQRSPKVTIGHLRSLKVTKDFQRSPHIVKGHQSIKRSPCFWACFWVPQKHASKHAFQAPKSMLQSMLFRAPEACFKACFLSCLKHHVHKWRLPNGKYILYKYVL